jgi:hypothetical protein
VIVHLVPVGRGRFDLYAEPPGEDDPPLGHDAGAIRRAILRAGARWRAYVDGARLGGATRVAGRWRDRVVCALADSVDEQRALWSLRNATHAVARFPSTSNPRSARAALHGMLGRAGRLHGWWLSIDLVLFVASGVLFFVPGPNIVAYYLGFRAFGHLQSWRGARQARTRVTWTFEANDALAELATLTDVPHAVRADRVIAIATGLELPHLPSFFERATT